MRCWWYRFNALPPCERKLLRVIAWVLRKMLNLTASTTFIPLKLLVFWFFTEFGNWNRGNILARDVFLWLIGIFTQFIYAAQFIAVLCLFNHWTFNWFDVTYWYLLILNIWLWLLFFALTYNLLVCNYTIFLF